MAKRRTLGRTCSCGASITDSNVSGKCKPCILSGVQTSEESKEKIRRGLERYYANPVNKARLAKIRSEAQRQAREANPEAWAAINRGNLVHARTPEAEAKRIAAIKASWAKRKMAWCPEEYRAEYAAFYRNLIRSRGIPYVEARAIVLDDIAHREAKMSPFERQDLALKRGATLYAAEARATLDRPGVYRS